MRHWYLSKPELLLGRLCAKGSDPSNAGSLLMQVLISTIFVGDLSTREEMAFELQPFL